MEILFVTPELYPLSGHGRTAEAIAALPKALRGLDHKAIVVSPLYAGIDPSARGLARRLSKIEVDIGGEVVACELYDGRTPGGVDLLMIGHPELFRTVSSMVVEGEAPALTAKRAGAFAKAAIAAVDKLDKRPDAIHGHGWVGALAIAFASESESARALPTVLSIHDAEDLGAFSKTDAKALGLSEADVAAAAHDGKVSALRLGLVRARRVVAPSSSFARALATPEGGFGLADAYAALGERLSGIANGVDASVWNPATDAKLASRFDPMDLTGKARDKAYLQRVLELPVRDDVPLLALVARSGADAGFDLFADIGPTVLRNDCQIVVVFEGAEDDALRARFAELAERWSDRIAVRGAGDGTLTHEALAAADLVLVPSRVDASSATHMIAQRYGALPIARRTGVLADTIVDCDEHLETGTGFLFDEASADELLAAVRRGLSAFHERGFRGLAARVMRIDHSWERAARLYERLYRATPEAEAASSDAARS